jgi:hypothetical protein
MYGFAYHEEADLSIVFGGRSGDGQGGLVYLNDTWGYDLESNSWRELRPSRSPPQGLRGSMVYDSASDRMVFAGAKPGVAGAPMETWAYDLAANSWTNMSPPVSPERRFQFQSAYDARGDRMVLFGGVDSPQAFIFEGKVFGDTWEYDLEANSWTRTAPAATPPPLSMGAMVYDSRLGASIIFGGRNKELVNFAPVWAYWASNDSWSKILSPPGPAEKRDYACGRDRHQAGFHERAGMMLVFSGYFTSGACYGGALGGPGEEPSALAEDTWVLDTVAGKWVDGKPAPRPLATIDGGTVYDSGSKKLVFFGSSCCLGMDNQTWTADILAEAPPYVVETSPKDGSSSVPTSASIVVRFSTPMEPSSTVAAISSAPSVAASASWSADRTGITLTPSSPLSPATSYELLVRDTASSASGSKMVADFRFSLTTAGSAGGPAPRVVSTSPADGASDVARNSAIEISFDREMDPAATGNAISASPPVPWSPAWDPSSSRITLRPLAALAPDTRFEVTVGPGARSAAGAALATPHVFSLTSAKPLSIVHSPPSGAMSGKNVLVAAKVSGGSGGAVAVLSYRDANGGFVEVPMVRDKTTGSYAANVPGPAVLPPEIAYFIRAEDAGGERASSPADAPTIVHKVKVVGEDGSLVPSTSAWPPLWVLLLLAGLVVTAVIGAVAARRRKSRCRDCGGRHRASDGCLQEAWGEHR